MPKDDHSVIVTKFNVLQLMLVLIVGIKKTSAKLPDSIVHDRKVYPKYYCSY